jgi:hypothetical protein
MAEVVARVYAKLPPTEQAECVIYCSDYGKAGVIDFFGPALGLPPASSGHNNYYFWGPPKRSGRTTIAIGMSKQELESIFEQVEQADVITHPYAMPSNRNLPVYVCRKPKVSIQEAWPRAKRFI